VAQELMQTSWLKISCRSCCSRSFANVHSDCCGVDGTHMHPQVPYYCSHPKTKNLILPQTNQSRTIHRKQKQEQQISIHRKQKQAQQISSSTRVDSYKAERRQIQRKNTNKGMWDRRGGICTSVLHLQTR
jgi:hypothetical protein